jgi:hypothetical protein
MPLAFLMTLLTYLIVVAAGLRYPTHLYAGIVNTLTLAIFLFSVFKALKPSGNRPFWIGFAVFFAAHFLLFVTGIVGGIFRYSLAEPLGNAAYSFIQSARAARPPAGSVTFGDGTFRLLTWCVHLSHCYVATLFGLLGGFLALRVNRRAASTPKPAS